MEVEHGETDHGDPETRAHVGGDATISEFVVECTLTVDHLVRFQTGLDVHEWLVAVTTSRE